MTTHPVDSVPVNTVTANAGRDELSDADYRDIYTEVRQRLSLRAFVSAIDSGYSIGWWSKYVRGELALTRQAKNELRRAVSLSPLPPTVAEVLADVDPDAEVVDIGDDKTVKRVLRLRTAQPLTICVNGAISARTGGVTEVTSENKKRRRWRGEMTEAQYMRWAAMSSEERDRALGIC